VIAAVAVCPHPPLLFRELTGQQDIAADLRAACLSGIAFASSTAPDVLVVVGGADETRPWDAGLRAHVRPYGTTGGRTVPGLPLSLGVGRRLLDQSGWRGRIEMHAIGWDATPTEVAGLAGQLAGRDERIALLVLGDGSTRRGEQAPGYIDARAFPFDDATGLALAEGDVQALMRMDAGLAQELRVSCRAAFAVIATAVHREGVQPRATVLFKGDPWGVMYYVATWQM